MNKEWAIMNKVTQVMSTLKNAMSDGFAFWLSLMGLSSTMFQIFLTLTLTLQWISQVLACCMSARNLQSESRLRSTAIV